MELIGGVIWDHGKDLIGNPIWGVFLREDRAYLMPVVPNPEDMLGMGFLYGLPDAVESEEEIILLMNEEFNVRIDPSFDYKMLLKLAVNYMDNEELERLELSDLFKITREKFTDKIDTL